MTAEIDLIKVFFLSDLLQKRMDQLKLRERIQKSHHSQSVCAIVSTPNGDDRARAAREPQPAMGVLSKRKMVQLSCSEPLPDQSDNVRM